MMRASIVLASSPGAAGIFAGLTPAGATRPGWTTMAGAQHLRRRPVRPPAAPARQRIGQSDQARVLNKADKRHAVAGEQQRRGRASVATTPDRCQRQRAEQLHAGARSPASAPTTSCPTASTRRIHRCRGLRGQGSRLQRERQSLLHLRYEKGRMHNSQIPPEERGALQAGGGAFVADRLHRGPADRVQAASGGVARPGWRRPAERCAEGFAQGTEMTIDDLYQDLQRRCCEQIAESDHRTGCRRTALRGVEPLLAELRLSHGQGASTRRSGCRAPRVSTACASAAR